MLVTSVFNTHTVDDEDTTPTGYGALTGEQKATLTELANFLYSEYESFGMDKRLSPVDDEIDDPFIEIQEMQ